MIPGEIRLSDYSYSLPAERIAKFPLEHRDQSRLLHFHKGTISHKQFFELPQLLPEGSLLVFNDTKVIPARLYLKRETGATIEVFLLNPHEPNEVVQAMNAQGSGSWQCMVGNKKRWKPGETIRAHAQWEETEFRLEANWINREENLLQLSWQPAHLHLSEWLSKLGELPLPPYLNRKAEKRDYRSYQTVYAQHEGAVAAPTAGLHFTQSVLDELEHKNIKQENVTLHVGAGTFQPVKHENALEHPMHAEQLVIRIGNLINLLKQTGPVVAVGTTSMRFLESIYWIGAQLLLAPEKGLTLAQTTPYEWQEKRERLPPKADALNRLLEEMKQRGVEQLSVPTEIYLYPGYQFQMVQALITNYHMPQTTLMLLVAALIGESWREVYESALEEGYRFLSYGDSSLLWP
ncbi:MAG: S-adenosylmethionine:tRNA ribosyltransferase-isomerase [Bacteroidota bacterium]